MPNVWVVKAGENNEHVGAFKEHGIVAHGGAKLGDLRRLKTRQSIVEKERAQYPQAKSATIKCWAAMHWKLLDVISRGDIVLTPIRATRELMMGVVVGDYEFLPSVLESYPHIRKVEWKKTVSRDQFSRVARNSLGSMLAIFSMQPHVEEIAALLEGRAPVQPLEPEEEGVDLYGETKGKADEIIADRLSKIDWEDFQHLVAATLRAMGMRTKVGGRGRDKGVDIVAHPDPLGFGTPKIKVQVKHRTAAIGAPDLRNFLATLRDDEKGLFVSTGGFTPEAWEEPERRGKVVTLLDGEDFIDLLLENYEKLEPEYQAMVPLRKLWIPVEPED